MNKKTPFITLLIIAIIFVAVVVVVYLYHFHTYSISPSPQQWGALGDFFGGILNPLLAFFSFMALLYTLYMQQEELQLTRNELKNSVLAQKETAEFTKSQSQTSLKQLKDLKTREKKNDIYLLIKSISDKIEHKLSQKSVSAIGGNEAPLIQSINFICNNYIDCSKDKALVLSRVGYELQYLKNELDELERLLGDFDNLAEHQYLSDYYKNIFSNVKAATGIVDE